MLIPTIDRRRVTVEQTNSLVLLNVPLVQFSRFVTAYNVEVMTKRTVFFTKYDDKVADFDVNGIVDD
jgi:hypothetical protein